MWSNCHQINFFHRAISVLLGLLSSILIVSADSYIGNRIIDAVNCGGRQHTDVFGVNYRSDPLAGKIGVPSDFGSRLLIDRVVPKDSILYQTERYHSHDFFYDVDMSSEKGRSDYVLVLKFSEVYFQSSGKKVFSVLLNNQHQIITDLDIFSRAGGQGIAHDELIPFSIDGETLRVFDQVSNFSDRLRITFVKGEHDNPKINAFYVLKGKISDIPDMPELKSQDEEMEDLETYQRTLMSDYETEDEESPTKSRLASGPKSPDPYAIQDHSQMFLPILIALACFFPVLFCLCKL